MFELRLSVLALAIVLFAGSAGSCATGTPDEASATSASATSASAAAVPSAGSSAAPEASKVPAAPAAQPKMKKLPGGGTQVFGHNRFLVAYYGTASTGSLGVLGETDINAAHDRVARASRPFKRPGEQVLPVYELIVTVADGIPGPDGDYSHDIAHELVQPYIDAAHRNGALLVLDLQTGRSNFADVAKRWEWALKDPYVGLALDPEWRMGPQEVPGRTIGRVGAREVNRTSAWLASLTARNHLPEKVFMLHQFRTSMLVDPARIKQRDGLAMVQHVDGFGNPGQKLATYAAVARPRQFSMGFKLFYDEDQPRMSADDVRRIKPRVKFVSFQ